MSVGSLDQFGFGENWVSFVSVVDEGRVAEAAKSLSRLMGANEFASRTFLDVGGGSGLHMIAALRLGASRADGFDIDPNSVAAAEILLPTYAPDSPWSVRKASILDENGSHPATYDIVYSWGVLHHTGDLWRSTENCLRLVSEGGFFVTAVYSRTPLCRVWLLEKRIYTRSPKPIQRLIRSLYKAIYLAGILLSRRDPRRYLKDYKSNRGMDWSHDVHDWLGGYPYQSAAPQETIDFMEARGFRLVRSFQKVPRLWGVLGTHCDEFVFKRK
jgi:SAM-dependent methyltransferase